MVYTRSNRRLSFFLALGLVAGGGLVVANPAHGQGGRFRVLVPNLERQGDVKKDFGEDAAKEVRKLIDGLPTHAPVENKDLKAALKQYKMKEDDLNCITSRQLAVQKGYELVMCGSYGATANGMEVKASFINAKSGETFDVNAFAASDPKQAAQQIFTSFDRFVSQVSLTRYCMQDLESQQWQSALDKCTEALQISPKSATALYGKGYALMKLEQLEPSLDALTAVLEVNPVHQEALLAAGFVNAKLGRAEESRKYYHQYLELNPGNAQVRLTVATEAAKAGDPEGALQIAEQGLQGDSADLTLVEYAGYFAAAAAARIEEPAKGQNGGKQQLPPAAAALYEKAMGYLDRVFAVKGDSVQTQLLVTKLSALSKLGKVQEAVDFGASAVAAKPGEAQIWSVYASTLQDAGRTAEALAALDSVVAKDPEAQNIRARQGQILLQDGQIEKARGAFRQAFERKELDSDLIARNIFVAGYNGKFQKGQQMEAIPYFEAAREFATEPQTKGMINFFHGYALYNRGMKVQEPSTAASAKESLPLFQKALDLFQQSSAYAQTQPSIKLDEFVNNAKQYIEIQELLIKRGR